ncbi:MAG: hypothetical protein MPK62_15630, partial [Alphaproteobacteria bacterium]|nr:hypothetical protein [Alphaproteobacteria bacterium]
MAAARKILPKSLFIDNIYFLEKAKTYNRQQMIIRFEEMGYKRVGRVQEVGEFTVRGEIIDIYCSSYIAPVRIDFFDEEIEEMRLFHTDTQISFDTLEHFAILPKKDNWIPPEILDRGIAKLEKIYNANESFLAFKQKIKRSYLPGLQNYLSFFYDNLHTLLDYLDPRVKVLEYNSQVFNQKLNRQIQELQVCLLYTS